MTTPEALKFPTDFPLYKYKPNQRARAAKISAIEGLAIWMKLGSLEWHFMVDPEFIDEQRPAVGGYFVECESGFAFFLPAKVFELGFSLLDEEPQTPTPTNYFPAVALLSKSALEMEAAAEAFRDDNKMHQYSFAKDLGLTYFYAAKALAP